MSKTSQELEAEYKAKLAEIEENKKQAEALKKQKELAKAEEIRRKNGRHKLPPGFSIRYNDRRGDPLFTPYYQLALVDSGGKEINCWRKSDRIDDDSEVRGELTDAAWKLVDQARVIMSHFDKEE